MYSVFFMGNAVIISPRDSSTRLLWTPFAICVRASSSSQGMCLSDNSTTSSHRTSLLCHTRPPPSMPFRCQSLLQTLTRSKIWAYRQSAVHKYGYAGYDNRTLFSNHISLSSHTQPPPSPNAILMTVSATDSDKKYDFGFFPDCCP